MNRVIKFRAWERATKTMRDADDVHRNLNLNHCIDLHNINQQMVLMQYTGLRDKNGKEIYEGDIIRRASGWEFTVIVREYLLGTSHHARAVGYDWHKEDEIVGNIYENPQLIPQ